MLFVPVSATFSEQTHRFEVFVPVFGSFSEQISIRTGDIKTGPRDKA